MPSTRRTCSSDEETRYAPSIVCSTVHGGDGMTADLLDTADPGFLDDPYPVLAELRAEAPLVWHEAWGVWLATTHGAVSAVLRDRRFGRIWTDQVPLDEMEPFNALHRNQMMENEPPAHTRLRRLVAGAFGRGHVERMRPRIAELAASAIHEARGARRVRIDASPEDVAALAEALGAVGQNADVQPDPTLERGSLVVHTDLGRVDARLRPQLTRLAEALREALR